MTKRGLFHLDRKSVFIFNNVCLLGFWEKACSVHLLICLKIAENSLTDAANYMKGKRHRPLNTDQTGFWKRTSTVCED